MISVARVILKKAKIVIMDEATANIDIESDLLVQELLNTELKDSTCLTIAHRINTIIDYDKILVLDKGLQVEYDHPFKLLVKNDTDEEISNEDGYFAQLIQALQEKDLVFDAARKSYKGEEKIVIKRQLYEKVKLEYMNGDG